jgi:hypothetical protein
MLGFLWCPVQHVGLMRWLGTAAALWPWHFRSGEETPATSSQHCDLRSGYVTKTNFLAVSAALGVISSTAICPFVATAQST